MLVFEFKAYGKSNQFNAVDEAIRSRIARGSGEQQKLYQFLKVGINIDIATPKALRTRSVRHLQLPERKQSN